ncbi:General transcription factor IIF subunit 1 [Trichinella britovi]|uniref:Transcription initiation factor IIF subunit alpha n=1 Tax=Trichinella britovi TaxID=45882 RepID=A0A0V1CIK9_TRIBR|nr:General transcription factor IIF subunit 1 [Trichinella britovi]
MILILGLRMMNLKNFLMAIVPTENCRKTAKKIRKICGKTTGMMIMLKKIFQQLSVKKVPIKLKQMKLRIVGLEKEAGQKVREARAGQKQFGIEAEFSYLFLPTLSTSVPDSKNCNMQASKEHLPLRLAVEANCKVRHYRGIRDGVISNYSDYWIFEKNGKNAFDAYLVGEIYNLIPVRDRKAMSIEEVEEHFKRRREIVLNQFALRARIRRPGEENDDDDESESALWKANNKDQQCKKSSKIDQFSGHQNEKCEKGAYKTETDKRNDHEDGVVMEESDDGDEDGREVDCISSGVELEEKTLVGIDEELTDAFQSVDESEQDDENAENDKQGVINQNSLCKFVVQEQESNSDSEDFDSEDIKSLFLLQCKTDVKPVSSKRKVELDSLAEQKPKKKAKLPNAGTDSDGSKFRIMEEEVRHCFQRHPMSTTDLVAKFKSRCKK